MTNLNFSRLFKSAIVAAAMFAPAQAFAYTCSNPAICIAVCGKKTCGRVSASDADIKRLDKKNDVTLSVGTAADARAKPYTCFNPAICIAVCGKKTCGE